MSFYFLWVKILLIFKLFYQFNEQIVILYVTTKTALDDFVIIIGILIW